MRFLIWLLCLLPPSIVPAAERLLTVDEDVEISIRVWPGGGDELLLWLPSEYGISPRNDAFAGAMAQRGLSVWLPDLHSAWFLAPGPHSLDSVPVPALRALLQDAVARHRRVYVLAASRTAPLALRLLRAYQQAGRDMRRIGGALLLHPKLYRRTPQGGEDAQYLPIARASNLPLYLLQPQLSSGHWRLPGLIQALSEGGAPVIAHSLPDTSDGFLTRMDATPAELRAATAFMAALPGTLRLLNRYGPPPTTPAPLPKMAALGAGPSGDRLLKPVPDRPPAPALALADLRGATQRLQDLRGSVVLVNFWATWCPPCVEEIPSLQRLHRRLQRHGFQILAVDVGESPAKVRAFLRDKPVDFPVLLDPDGEALKTWKVYAFPTSLVVDRQGRIRYAVYGAFQWDAPEVLETLVDLL